LFAYPSGGHDPEVRRAVAAAGFRAAFTTAPGLARPGTTDPLQLPRVNVGRRSPTAVVLARLAARRLGRRAWERQPTSATFMGLHHSPCKTCALTVMHSTCERGTKEVRTRGSRCAGRGAGGARDAGL